MRVAVMRFDNLGDAVLTTPLIRCLAKAGHQVDVLVRGPAADVFLHSPFAAAFAIEDIAPSFPRDWRTLGRWLRSRRYGAVFLPYARPPALLLASLASGAPLRVAMWAGVWGRVTLHKCLRSGIQNGDRHISDIMLDIARAAGIPTDGLKSDLFLTGDERRLAAHDFEIRFGGRPVVIIHPGHRRHTCNPGPEVYGELAAVLLKQTTVGVVVSGVADESRLLGGWPPDVQMNPLFWNAMGRWSVRELAAHLACCAVLVVTGTGPLHMASAVGAATVSPFCRKPSLRPTVWGSLGERAVTVGPPADFCLRRPARLGHCTMAPYVSAFTLFEQVLRVLPPSCVRSGRDRE